MCKRVMIGLFIMSVVALVWTDANAGCCCNPQQCGSWIKGARIMAIVITEGYANEGESSTLQRASPPILLQRAGPPVLSEVRATAYGTVGSNCGPPSHGRNPSCRLEGFVFCGHPLSPPEKISTNTRDYDGDRRYQRRRHTIVGPLTASAFRGSCSVTALEMNHAGVVRRLRSTLSVPPNRSQASAQTQSSRGS